MDPVRLARAERLQRAVAAEDEARREVGAAQVVLRMAVKERAAALAAWAGEGDA